MEITVSVVAMIIPCYHIIILDSVGPHKMVVEKSVSKFKFDLNFL